MDTNNKKGNLEGYPHYPASEDITKTGNNNGRALRDDLNDPVTPNTNDIGDKDRRDQITSGNGDADVTADDLQLLDAAEQNMDSTDDLNLQHAKLDNVDEDGDPLNEAGGAGADLDVPGSGQDDADENIGEEDEENNYYSLGGDLHEAQEENKGE